MRDTKHFSDMIKERCIRPEWTDDVLKYPDKIEDKEDGTRHYLKKIRSYGNRWLRVVININKQPPEKNSIF